MLRFISIGSGSSGNCYYLDTADDALLIDAGVGVRGLKKHVRDYGLSLSRVHHILITQPLSAALRVSRAGPPMSLPHSWL